MKHLWKKSNVSLIQLFILFCGIKLKIQEHEGGVSATNVFIQSTKDDIDSYDIVIFAPFTVCINFLY